MLCLPPALAVAFRLLLPWLRDLLLQRWLFDLAPYFPLIASGLLLIPAMIGGVITGFMLLDERDEGVWSAVAVTPISLARWLGYRLALPVAVGTILAIATYPLAGVAPLRIVDLVAISIVASLLAPITALFLAVFAENKVSGFAMIKILNAVNLLPIMSWFVEPPLRWVGAAIPSYWPMRMVWNAASGQGYIGEAAAGLAVSAVVVTLLARRFEHLTHR
ncbi:MAG: hypothetical protein ABI779_06010 [Acidobacteriota bacterium]